MTNKDKQIRELLERAKYQISPKTMRFFVDQAIALLKKQPCQKTQLDKDIASIKEALKEQP